VLTDANTIGIWVNQQKLPNDKFSIENAIILKNSSRWPLMIDPQVQANQWIREMAGKTDIRVLRQNTAVNELLFQLENSISFGYPILLENIGEDIDPIFEPVL
jgi:dynein heavy chain, axonemal